MSCGLVLPVLTSRLVMPVLTPRLGISALNPRLVRTPFLLTPNHFSKVFHSSPTARIYSKNYDESFVHVSPHSNIVLPETSLPEFFWDRTESYSTKIAMKGIDSRETKSFDELKSLAIGFAKGLKALNFTYRDVLAIMMHNYSTYPAFCLGAQILGGCVTPVSRIFQPEEALNQLSHSEAKVLLTTSKVYEIIQNSVASKSQVKFVVTVDKKVGNSILLDDLIKNDDSDLFFMKVNPRKDLCFLPYTGESKGIMLTHYNIVSNLLQSTKVGVSTMNLKNADTSVQEAVLSVLPFYHMFGLMVAFKTLILGKRLVTLPKFDTKSYLELIKREQPGIIYMVPTLGELMVDNDSFDKIVMKSVHSIYSGGAPLRSKLCDKLAAKFDHLKVYQGYGLTETSPIITMSLVNKPLAKSIGQCVPNTKARVVDVLTGANLGPNEEGELQVQGPQVMKGYLKDPSSTKMIIRSDNWLCTGDIVKFDENGNFFIVDRCKDLIKVKGHQVTPQELEKVLNLHPKVKEAAVVGIPDKFAGEAPFAFIVKGDQTLEAEDIHDYMKDTVSEYKQLIGGIKFVTDLPKEPNGKILRVELKQNAKKIYKRKEETSK